MKAIATAVSGLSPKTRMFAAATLLAALAAAPVQAQSGPQPSVMPGNSGPVCLRPFDSPSDAIDHTHAVNSRTILFYMRDGKIWQNTLATPCPGLMFHGFDFVTHQDEICSNAQSIRVLESGEVCALGPFTPYTRPQHSASAAP
jgi:hypothetical protein